jgi:hypothetical protein
VSGWRIEVPSAGRAATLAAKTWPWLVRAGVADRARVWIPEAERDAYAAAVPEADLVPLDYEPAAGPLDEGPYGLGVVRNAIADAASPGDLVVQVDDDLDGLREYTGMKDAINARLVDVDDLVRIAERGFALAEDAGAYLWGLHPAATYCRPRLRLDLCYVGGGLFGVRHRGEPEVEHVKLDDKEDFERSLRFYERDGRLLRLDGVSWRTRGYGGAGGMQTTRTPERIDASAKWCAERWPQWAALKYPRSGKTELRLADRRRSA